MERKAVVVIDLTEDEPEVTGQFETGYGFVLKASQVHGTGVFSSCCIPEGVVLGKYDGVRLSDDQLKDLYPG